MLFAMGFLNAGNYGFTVLVARILPPNQFATYAILYGAVTLLAVPANVLRLAIIRLATADAGRSGENTVSAELMNLRHNLFALVLAGGTVLLFLVTLPLFTVTRGANVSSYLLAGFAGIITFTLYLDRGFLQGGLRFSWVAVTVVAEVGGRLGFLLLLAVALNTGLVGTMAALLAGALLANAVSARMVSRCTATNTECEPATGAQTSPARTLLGYTAIMMAAYSAHTALRWVDLLFVQRLFPGELAGQYAALSFAGKVILFASLGITETLFTFANKAHWRHEAGEPLLARALLFTAAVGLPILLLYAAAPEAVLKYGFGSSYTGLASSLWIMGLFMFLLSLSGVLIAYMLASGMARGALAASMAAVALEVTLFLAFHDSIETMVASLCTMAAFYFTVLSALVAWNSIRARMTNTLGAVPDRRWVV
jgi:O-antigen/teichoic acid export membrane protein